MANAFTYEIDTSQWDALMGELNARKLKAAWKSGLRPSAKTIERGVLSQLASKHPAANKYSKEVRIKMWSKSGGYTVNLSQGQLSFKISKSGKVVKDSHLYILRWLSAGTQPRKTKSGYNRGKITASNFFGEGVEQSLPSAIDSIDTDITKALQRAVMRARQAKPNPQK